MYILVGKELKIKALSRPRA